jgi:hypothetical protein
MSSYSFVNIVLVTVVGRFCKMHLGHPKVTVARQSDSAHFTLGLNSSKFCSRSLFPLLSILPLRRSSQIITCKIVIFLGAINSLIYLEHSSIKSFCQADSRLLWPLKLNHYLIQWSVFIWRNSQSIHSTFHTNLHNCTVRSLNKLFLNSIWQESKS